MKTLNITEPVIRKWAGGEAPNKTIRALARYWLLCESLPNYKDIRMAIILPAIVETLKKELK